MKAIITIAVAIMVLATGCGKDLDRTSPAYKLDESEKLSMPSPLILPSNAPKGNSRVTTYYAEGVQKYKSQTKPNTNPVEYEWIFVAPQADLYDHNNAKVGTHGAGPYWTLSPNDSIFAQAFTPARNFPVGDGVDWLLLMPKADKQKKGVFADVSYIQRIATKGGKAPAFPPVTADATVEVPYTAIYRFTRINP